MSKFDEDQACPRMFRNAGIALILKDVTRPSPRPGIQDIRILSMSIVKYGNLLISGRNGRILMSNVLKRSAEACCLDFPTLCIYAGVHISAYGRGKYPLLSFRNSMYSEG